MNTNLKSLTGSNELPISYDKETNVLSLNLPDNLKIKINQSLNFLIDGNFNLLTNNGEINILSLFKNVHIDSYAAQIHLNSRRAAQLGHPQDYEILPIDIEIYRPLPDLIKHRKQLLFKIFECLDQL